MMIILTREIRTSPGRISISSGSLYYDLCPLLFSLSFLRLVNVDLHKLHRSFLHDFLLLLFPFPSTLDRKNIL